MKAELIAWAAGLLEGEGCFSLHKRGDRPNTFNSAIHCEMTDEDVIKTLHSIFNVGTVCQRPARVNRKPTWIWSVQKQKDIFDVLVWISPYMHGRRKSKISEMIKFLEGKVCEQN